jgi:anti-sigma regulatory factor (Ser/Thr protein kinase)
MSGLVEEEQVSLGAAFRETLANAAQHGNKHRRDKLLEVLYLLDKEKIIITITDSGFGFDWQKYVNINKGGNAIGRARQSQKEGRLGGLGIMLIMRCVDKLEYNDTGNVATLTKYWKKK